jgi:diguanylate cyclase (GGDEF)-like protein
VAVARWLAWLLCLLLPGMALAGTAQVGRDVLLLGAATDEQTPQRACPAEVLARHQQVLAVAAPAEGWSGAPQAVDVFGVLSGEVRISHGDRQICGNMHDARTRDSRFRAGVGMVVVPKAGEHEPIIVSWASPLKPAWIPTVRLGAPSPVQQNDTARLLVRAACIAVVIALALSALMGYVTAKDRSFLIYVAVCLVFVLWQAVLGGLSGYPEPWLPVHDRAAWWLMALSAFALATLLPILWRLNGGDRLWPGSRVGQQAVLWGLVAVGAAVPWMGLAALTWTAAALQYTYVLGCVVCAGVGLWALWRRDRYALAGLLALAPWWIMILADALDARWLTAYRIEALQLSATWFLMMSAYALNLRLGRLRQQRDELRQLADTDGLTGLPNRRAGLRLLARHMERALLEQQPLAIGFLDIDLFKDINDQFGHEVGDQVLVAVARGLRGAVRSQDDVIRMGGEEFLVLLPGAGHAAALARLESVRQQVASVSAVLGIAGLAVTASIGAAVLRPGRDDLAGLLRRADHAMYRAKRAGRNQVCDAEQPVPADDPVVV